MVPTRSSHPFWMYEEIRATPDALDRVLAPDEMERAHRERLAARLAAARRVYLTGCGTAYHAALVGEAFLRDMTDGRIDARAVQAFELAHYRRPAPGPDDALIVLSHSGKPTATNAALAAARAGGAFCLTITGDPASPAALAAEAVLDTGYAEVKSFAYTISYSLMLAALADLAVRTSIALTTEAGSAASIAARVPELPRMHREALALDATIQALAQRLAGHDRWFFAGAGANYATALEAALKVQETSYTAAAGMEMEEVLHGPVARLGDAALVVIAPPGTAPRSPRAVPQSGPSEPFRGGPRGAGRTRALDLLRAAAMLGAATVALGETGDAELEAAADAFLPLPAFPEPLTCAPYHVPLHLLSYWLAVAKGANPDLMRREDARYLDARRSYTL
jgi:glucosamine--fructose-6-phosphate aminotransferase (isomerizing)